MSEIKEGDLVTWNFSQKNPPLEWSVEAVRGDSAWLAHGDGIRRRSVIRPVKDLTKVEPKFEVGKIYRRKGIPKSNSVRVTKVNEEGAIGWVVNSGYPWSASHKYIFAWEEVTDETFPVTEQADETPVEQRPLVECKIVTRYPEHYRLHNLHDGSRWLIELNGTWTQYAPPDIPSF